MSIGERSIAERTALDIEFAAVGGRTVLTRRRYRWPLLIGRVFRDPARPLTGSVTIQNAAGTVIPGDTVRTQISVVDAGSAVVRGQGATVVSGIPGGDLAVEDTRVRVTAGCSLRLDPSPRIVTPHARYRQYTQLCVENGGRAVLTDTVVLHPDLTAANFGRYESTVAVTAADGSLLAHDAQMMATLPRVRRAPKAFGTVYIVGVGLDTTMTALSPELESLSVLAGESRVYVAVSDLPNQAGWAIRLAASDGGILRSVAAAATAIVDAGVDHIRANRAITKQ